MMTLAPIIIETNRSPSESPVIKILFLNLDDGLFKPQNGQTEAERLISFRQPGQSREFFWLVFDIFVYYPNISMVIGSC
jgi:hypothetical protein